MRAVRSLLVAVAVLLVSPGLVQAQPALSFSQLQARWPGPWHAFTSRGDGTLRFLAAPGVAEARVEALVADVARLADADPDGLVLALARSRTDHGRLRELRRFDRFWRGVQVVGDEVLVAIVDGRVGAVWVRLGPVAGLPAPRAGELVRRLPDGRAVLARRVVRPGRIEWLDRSGAVVLEEPTRFDATLTLTREAYAPGDALETTPARDVVVTDGDGATEVTDDDGVTSLTGPLDVTLDGPHLTVELAGSPVRAEGVDDGDLLAGTDLPHEAANVHHHTGVVRDWLAARWSDPSILDDHTQAAIDDLTLPCNAYYDDQTDRFGYSPEVQGCPAMARFGDIVAHENGHRVHSKIRVGGVVASDVGEGSADFVSATIHDSPRIALGVSGPGVALRDIERDRVYPDDVVGEPHADGLIWASFLWDLRQALIRDLGEVEGVDATDRIFLGTLEQGPQLTELWSALLVADDDDGDLTNGTPHACLILGLLEEHGLGPDALGIVQLAHEAPGSEPSAATSYPLVFAERTTFPACDEVVTRSATLRYTTSPGAALPSVGGEDAAWTSLPLAVADGQLEAELPRQPANTLVRYFVEVTRSDGRVLATHNGTPDRLWWFWVGDRRVVWCDDLEGDVSGWDSAVGVPFRDDDPRELTNDWEFGRASGARGEPDVAHSGVRIVGTWLDGDYLPNNAEQLLTPEVDLGGGGVMRIITLARWLGVEDGLYDHAGIWGLRSDGVWQRLWSNHATNAGTTHLIDGAWTKAEHDLSPALAPNGSHAGPLRVAFTLETDPGLQLSGWAIDDVCIEELAEPERHYRVRDLVVTRDDAERPLVTLTWSMPWIQPVTRMAIVRRRSASPTSVTDGSRVLAPLREQWIAGAALQATDTPPGAGTYHYAIFLAGRGEGDEWYTEPVPGENEGAVTIDAPPVIERDAAPPPVDAESAELDAGPGPAAEPGGCSCRSSGAPRQGEPAVLIGAGLVVLLAARQRVRRARAS